jgi:hypothetical protein
MDTRAQFSRGKGEQTTPTSNIQESLTLKIVYFEKISKGINRLINPLWCQRFVQKALPIFTERETYRIVNHRLT